MGCFYSKLNMTPLLDPPKPTVPPKPIHYCDRMVDEDLLFPSSNYLLWVGGKPPSSNYNRPIDSLNTDSPCLNVVEDKIFLHSS